MTAMMGRAFLCAALFFAAPAAMATDAQAPADANTEAAAPAFRAERVRTITIGGRAIPYRVVAEDFLIPSDEAGVRYPSRDEPAKREAARIFTVSYMAGADDGAAARPVIFLFNGGPGSSSVWLHIGAFGPRRLDMPDGATNFGAPPFALIDNSETLLDVADLVFIDPAMTGWSRLDLTDAKNESRWLTSRTDAATVAAAIRQWIERHERWNAPRYLLGESYGAVRAAAILDHVSEEWRDLTFNGAILVSSGIGAGEVWSGEDVASDAASYLPTYAAIARYHGKGAKRQAKRGRPDPIENFAVRDLARAVMLGAALGAAESDAIAEEAAALTGLPASLWRERRFDIGAGIFAQSLLAEDDRFLGRYDARMTTTGASGVNDPSNESIVGAFVDGVNFYLRNELSFARPGLPYEILYTKTPWYWDYFADGKDQRHPRSDRAAGDIAATAARNKEFRVFVASGLYDLVTPFFGIEMALGRAGLDDKTMTLRRYEGGHMMYLNEDALGALSRDIRGFIGASQ